MTSAHIHTGEEYNPFNERAKYNYREYLKEAKQRSEATVVQVDKAIERFDKYNSRKDFGKFNRHQAIGFKRFLRKQKNWQTGRSLSLSTLHSTLRHLRTFFRWLSHEPEYRSKIRWSDADYFRLSKKESRAAAATIERSIPTIEQILTVLMAMPKNTSIERRNRALIAFAILTGARVESISTFRLKHINTDLGSVLHDAKEVKTKFSKTTTTYFFPVGEVIGDIVVDWIDYLQNLLGWCGEFPLFPSTDVRLNDYEEFEATGLKRTFWASTGPIRHVFKQAFSNAGLPYFNPHSYRKTLARYGLELCKTPEELKAWSQNLAHDDVLTTLTSYGEVSASRQEEILRRLGTDKKPMNEEFQDDVRQLVNKWGNKMR